VPFTLHGTNPVTGCNACDAYGDAMVVADMYTWHSVAVEQENTFSLARFQPYLCCTVSRQTSLF
jgi:hypothetical protein